MKNIYLSPELLLIAISTTEDVLNTSSNPLSSDPFGLDKFAPLK